VESLERGEQADTLKEKLFRGPTGKFTRSLHQKKKILPQGIGIAGERSDSEGEKKGGKGLVPKATCL